MTRSQNQPSLREPVVKVKLIQTDPDYILTSCSLEIIDPAS
jgi:hypothetical protein